jgi:hypothetical protein
VWHAEMIEHPCDNEIDEVIEPARAMIEAW